MLPSIPGKENVLNLPVFLLNCMNSKIWFARLLSLSKTPLRINWMYFRWLRVRHVRTTQGFQKKTNKFYWVSNWLRFYSLYFPGEQISLKQEHYTTKITQLLLSWTRRNTKFNRTDDKVNKYNLPRALVLTSSQTSSFIVCFLCAAEKDG